MCRGVQGDKVSKHPMQPVELVDGVARFKKNNIVRYLLDLGVTDLNKLWLALHAGAFSMEDMEQFYQLIGYSVEGFAEIDDFCRATVRKADRRVASLLRANAIAPASKP